MAAQLPIPSVTGAQVKELERLMAETYHVGPLQMMESTGRALAHLARQLLEEEIVDRPVVVLAGRGSNGGGGLAAARHLLNWGAWVQVVCSYAAHDYKGAPAEQLAALQAMGAALAWAEDGWELPPCDLLIDAVIGCGLRGSPRGQARSFIELANSNPAPILSLDTPSGVDTETGSLFAPHVQAAATLALALPKSGQRNAAAAAACGDLYLADIGVPAALYEQLGITIPLLFTRDSIVRLHVEKGEIWTEEQ
jgi:NAD(P)H-hydrate epimerase